MYAAKYRLVMLMPTILLGSCVIMPPNEPSIMVLPGTGKSFEQFQVDNEMCKQFAYNQVAGRAPQNSAIDSGVLSATVGTILGAAAGAAIDGSHGAAVGAGAGLALGGLSGVGAADYSAARVQQRYDVGYQQCMYAKGHRIPVAGGLMSSFFRDYIERASVAPAPPPGRVLR